MGWDLKWWGTMVVIAAINWIIAVFIFKRSIKLQLQEPNHSRYFLYLRILGAIFVSVALYRSVFVSSYSNKLAWFDTILNSPFIIRCMATFAELSFIGMIAIILLKLNEEIMITKNLLLVKSPFIAVGSIFLAQFFAFAGLITQYLTPFAIEETLWAMAFLSITPLIIVGLTRMKKQITIEKSYKRFLIIMAVWCGGYLAFQLFYALPFMYYANLAQDLGKSIPTDALKQAIFSFTTTRDYGTWGGLGFFIWHSCYFSICVWMVLFFMSAPRKRKA